MIWGKYVRIGVYPSFADPTGNFLDASGLGVRAQMIENAGLDGIWLGDHLPPPGGTALGQPDALMILAVSAMATSHIEVGTNIYCIPNRNRYDVLQHLYTLETLFPKRFTIGLSTGSQKIDYEVAGNRWEDRFRLLYEAMDDIRAMCVPPAEGVLGTSEKTMVGTWAQIVGLPRLVLGAWHSETQLKRAAAEYDGWITSGRLGLHGVGWRKSFSESIKKYRDLGGKRAMISTVNVDLRQPAKPIDDAEAFSLECPPEEASERLHYLAELGFDDIILNLSDHTSTVRSGPHLHDFTTEDLEQVRSLLPKGPSAIVG